jgi:hypothetical protein
MTTTMTTTTTTTAAGVGGGGVCHVLPCSIDEDATAPVARYFRPAPVHRALAVRTAAQASAPAPSSAAAAAIGDDGATARRGDPMPSLPGGEVPGATTATTTDVEDDDDGAKEEEEEELVAVVLAAQFRGRGLLCVADPSSSPSSFDGRRDKRRRRRGNATATTIATTTTSGTTTPLSELPPGVLGVVFSPSPHPPSSFAVGGVDLPAASRSLRAVETFRSLRIWSHEHDVRAAMADRLDPGGGGKCGLGAALGWRDLAREVSVSGVLRVFRSKKSVPPLVGRSSRFYALLNALPFVFFSCCSFFSKQGPQSDPDRASLSPSVDAGYIRNWATETSDVREQ